MAAERLRAALGAGFGAAAEALTALAAVGIAVTVCLNLAQVVARYVFFVPFAWTEEAMRYVMVWVTMLGAAATMYRGEETTAGMLGWVPSRLFQAGLHLLRVALILCAGLLLAWFGFPFALNNWTQESPAAQIPMWMPFLAFGVGGAAIALLAVGMIVAPHRPREDALRPEDSL
jgi:TRAP-type C4-dicarboxylate transport system permease small subunit